MFHAVVLWLHILAAVAFIGPQIFLVVAAMPAIRTIADVKSRAAATRVMTTRFGMLGGAALLVLIVTGIMNYTYANSRHDLDAKRYFIALQIKLTLVLVVVILTILHGAVLGRRLQRLREEPDEPVGATEGTPDAADSEPTNRMLPGSLDTIGLLAVLGVALGGALTIVGALMPWAKAPLGISKSGVEGDGVITLILAIVVIAVGVVRAVSPSSVWHWVLTAAGLLIGVAILGIAIYDISDVNRVSGDALGLIDVGAGLYVSAVAGGLIAMSALLNLASKPLTRIRPAPLSAYEIRLAQVRQWSMWLSMANLAAGIVILLCAAVLGSAWSTMGSLR